MIRLVRSVAHNVLFGFDVAWRVAPGTRVYGEAALDDLHARTNDNPTSTRIRWAGKRRRGRGRGLTWGAEYTRLTRFVYTVVLGRDFESHDRPLGFPTGPDSRRVRAHGAWDLSTEWQIAAGGRPHRSGENDLDEPFLPGSPAVGTHNFRGRGGRNPRARSGRSLLADVGRRPQPVRRLTAGSTMRAHVPGARSRGATGALSVRLVR